MWQLPRDAASAGALRARLRQGLPGWLDAGGTIGLDMIDSATGQAPACPLCNSPRVRWRRRRLYDVPLTWARHLIELMYSATFGSSVWRAGTSPGTPLTRERAEILEVDTGGRTATSFWRCPECRQKGEVFDPKPKRSRVEDRTRPPD